jgi:leucyl/phenylalanyl-tRNA--protein transferase
MAQLPLLANDNLVFPPIDTALREPDGLLAAGGDLSVARLTAAYRQGIFPWFDDEQPILWWSPDPRVVLFPNEFKPSRSLSKLLRQHRFEVTLDQAFDDVIDACSEPRRYSAGTWITRDMKVAYKAMHRAGLAHSIECHRKGTLVGGLYGVGLGNLFFGESMFHTESDASKVAFAHLVRMLNDCDCPLIDCQIGNPHLASLGAIEIPRIEFASYLVNLAQAAEIDWQALPRTLPPW